MNFPDTDFSRLDKKPDAPWSTEELMTFFEKSLINNDFYMIALDNEVTAAIDKRQMEWSIGDITNNRPALSRWHAEYKGKFNDFLEQ